MKLVKVLSGIVVVLVILAVAAAVIIPLALDPNDYKDDVQALVKKRTGRDLTIEGNMQVSVFPWLGLTVGQATLGNAQGFAAPYFARIDSMRARVKLMPLLGQELEMDTVEIDGLQLQLAKNQTGETNWDDLVAATTKSQPDEATGAATPSKPPPVTAVALGGVDIRNSGLTWSDATTGRAVKVQNLHAQSGAIELGNPLSVSLSFDISGLAPGITGHIETKTELHAVPGQSSISASGLEFQARLRGENLPDGTAELNGTADTFIFDTQTQKAVVSDFAITADGVAAGPVNADLNIAGSAVYDAAEQLLNLARLDLTGTLAGGPVPGGKLPFAVNAAGSLNLASQQLGIGELNVSLPDIQLEGLSGELSAKTSLAGQLDERRFVVGVETLRGEFTGKDLPGGKLSIDARTDVALDLLAQTLSVKILELAAADLKGTISADVTQLLDAPTASGRIDLGQFSPKALLALAGQPVPKTADAEALTKASLSTRFKASPTSLSLDKLALRLDESTIKGDLTVPDLTKQALAFNLQVDKLDADRYLPREEQTGGKQAKTPVPATPGAAAAGAAGLPVESLRALDLKGRLRVGNLKAMQLRMSKVDVGISAKQGLIAVDPLQAALYGGTYKGAMKLDARGKTAKLSVNETLSKVKADRLLAALKVDPGVDLGGGRSTISIKANATGDTVSQTFTFKNLGVRVDLSGKEFPKGRLKFGIGADVNLDLKAQALAASKLKVDIAGAEVTGNLAIDKLLSDPTYTAELSLPKFNPRKVMAALGQQAPPTADAKALGSATLALKAIGSASDIDLQAIDLKLDQSRMTGALSVTNFASPAIRFNLDIDELDADRYLPPAKTPVTSPKTKGKSKKKSAKEGAAKVPSPGAATLLLPAELLRKLNLDGELRVGQLTINRMQLKKVVLKTKAKDGKVAINPMKARLYRGQYSGNVRINAQGKEPRINFDESLDGTEAGQILHALHGKSVVSGVAKVKMKGTAVGQTEDRLRRSLTGDLTFSLRDGRIQGINLLGLICGGLRGLGGIGSGGKIDAKAILGGLIQGMGKHAARNNAAAHQGNSTEFAELDGTVQVNKGLATNRDMVMRSPLLRVTGNGKADLVNERLNYNANARLVGSCAGQSSTDQNLAGIDVPVRVSGTFAQPKFDADLGGVISAVTRGRTRQRQASQPARSTPQPAQALDNLLRGGLKGLFGN